MQHPLKGDNHLDELAAHLRKRSIAFALEMAVVGDLTPNTASTIAFPPIDFSTLHEDKIC